MVEISSSKFTLLVRKQLNFHKFLYTMTFYDFLMRAQIFHDFQGLKNIYVNPMTFQVFHDRYEPCSNSDYRKSEV